VVVTPRHASMVSEAYVHLARRRNRDRISRLRADTEVLRGRPADEPTRSSYRASWLFLNSIPEDPCLVGVHSLLVVAPCRMSLPLAGPGPLPRREDSRSNMRPVRLGPSYYRQRIGAFIIPRREQRWNRRKIKPSDAKPRTLHPCGSSVAAGQPRFGALLQIVISNNSRRVFVQNSYVDGPRLQGG
jgi:hypothetical protein